MARGRTLVLGGVRSGKSGWAERQLTGQARVDYLATAAERDDADWAARIAEHRRRRPAHWRTVQTLDLAGALAAPGVSLLIEDLGNWLARTIDATGGWDGDLAAFRAAADELVTAWRRSRRRVVLVSSEVGLAVHADTRAGRVFADELGRLNAALAVHADEVVLVVAGLPLWLRGPAPVVPDDQPADEQPADEQPADGPEPADERLAGEPEPDRRQSGERQ